MLKLTTNLVLIGTLLVVPAYAGDYHHHPKPTPINVPDDGSNHNALAIGIVIAAGVCWYYKCWKPKKMVAETNLVPEVPKNEYIQIRPKR